MAAKFQTGFSTLPSFKWFVVWACIAVLTGISIISTAFGFRVVAGADSGEYLILAWAMSLVVMVFQIAALHSLINTTSIRRKAASLFVYLLLFGTSVGFGVGFWGERMNAKTFAIRDFTDSVIQLDRGLKSAKARLTDVRQNLESLVVYSSQAKLQEESQGGTFLNSPEGPGPRMHLRRTDAQTSNSFLTQCLDVEQKLALVESHLEEMEAEFEPSDVDAFESQLRHESSTIRAVLEASVFTNLNEWLAERVALGQNGLPHEDKILNIADPALERLALNIKTSISRLPEPPEVDALFRPGGKESVRMVFDRVADAVVTVVSFRPPTWQEINQRRTRDLRTFRSSAQASLQDGNELDPIAIVMGCLIDILIAVGVFVAPSRSSRKPRDLMPHMEILAEVILALYGDHDRSCISEVPPRARIRAFCGDNLGPLISTALTRDRKGRYHLSAQADMDLEDALTLQRFADLLVHSGLAEEAPFQPPFVDIHGIKESIHGAVGRSHERTPDIIPFLEPEALRIHARLSDEDFRKRLDVEYERLSSPELLSMQVEA